MSVLDAAKLINEFDGIAIPAHSDGSRGVFQHLSGTPLSAILKIDDIFAFELLNPDSIHLPNNDGSEFHPTSVIGSDCHHPLADNYDVSSKSRFTWIKMGEPTIEGLRLALIDGAPLSVKHSDASLNDPNQHPNLTISCIQVKNAYQAGRGQPLVVRFSPWMSAIIGGRGTGKSTIIEMLRLALRRDRDLPPELKTDIGRYASVARSRDDTGALTDCTEIDVVIRKGPDSFRVHWSQASNGPEIERKLDDSRWEASSGDVRSRFPVQIFSQRQILALANDPSALLRLVDAASEFGNSDWGPRLEKLENRAFRLASKLQELRAHIAHEERMKGELEGVDRQVAILESTSSREVLVAFGRLQRQNDLMNARRSEMTRAVARLREAADDVEPTDLNQEEFDTAESGERDGLKRLRSAASTQSSLVNRIRKLADRFDQYVCDWSAALTTSEWNSRLPTIGWRAQRCLIHLTS